MHPTLAATSQVESADDVAWLYKRVQALAGARIRAEGRRPALITMCESAMGLLELRWGDCAMCVLQKHLQVPNQLLGAVLQ